MSSKKKRKQRRRQRQQEANRIVSAPLPPEERLLVSRVKRSKHYLMLDATGGPMPVVAWEEAHVWTSVEEALTYHARVDGLELVTLVVGHKR